MKYAFPLLLLSLILGYGVLIFSSHGILFAESVEQGMLLKNLKCRYFTGTGTIEKTYLYSESNTVGRAACPRTIYYGDQS